MTSANVIVTAAFLGSLGIQARGAKTCFVSPEEIPPRTKLIGGLFLGFAAVSFRILTTAKIDQVSAIAALFLYSLAAILFFSAARANRERLLTIAFTSDAPLHLVTAGPYDYVRHPFYSSYCLTWLASAVATHSPTQFVVFLSMNLIYLWAARFEEGKFTRSELALEYSIYRERTGMFLPKWRIICGRRPEPRGWSQTEPG